MMLNNDEVIEIINKNYYERQIKYKIHREESLKKKRFKAQKRIKAIKLSLAVGTLCICSLVFALGLQYQKPNENISSTSSIVLNTNINQDINTNQSYKDLFDNYCNSVYNINPEIAYSLALELTDNFTNKEYLETLNPAFKVSNKKVSNVEQGIIIFLRHLSQIPQDFNLSAEQILNKNFNSKEKGNEPYKVKYYSDLFGIDEVLTLAIQYQESSKDGIPYNSNAYLNYNNPAGLMNPANPSELWKFESPDAGIIEHIVQLRYNYIDKGFDTPSKIRNLYAPTNAKNDPNDLNKYWVEGVTHFMETFNSENDIFNNNEFTKKN